MKKQLSNLLGTVETIYSCERNKRRRVGNDLTRPKRADTS